MTEPFVRLNIGGMPKLLKKLSGRVMDKAILKGLRVGAHEITGWIKEKRLTGPRPKYLGVVTGRLRSSITSSRAIKRGQRYLATIGTNVVYARKHEHGDPSRNLPARPFLSAGIRHKRNISMVVKRVKDFLLQAQMRA